VSVEREKSHDYVGKAAETVYGAVWYAVDLPESEGVNVYHGRSRAAVVAKLREAFRAGGPDVREGEEMESEEGLLRLMELHGHEVTISEAALDD